MDSSVTRCADSGDGDSGSGKDGTFTLLLFAAASTYAADTESLTLAAPMTLAELFSLLERRFPGIGPKVLRSAAVTVNLDYLDIDVDALWDEVEKEKEKGGGSGSGEGAKVVIRKGDEVGIIPPVSSG